MPLLAPYRGDSASTLHDDVYDVPIRRYPTLDALTIDTTNPARYIVGGQSLPLDFLVMPKRHERLLVGFHGLEARATTDLPKFQFVRSFGARPEASMFLSDSTLLLNEALSLGWMVGCDDTPLADLYGEAMRIVGAALGVTETLLVGHSAGGFAAMRVGCRVPNSRAVSVNGQVIATDYEPWTATALRDAVLPGRTVGELAEAWAERIDLRRALDARVEGSSFTYFGHRDDPVTMTRLQHYPPLAEWAGVGMAGGRTVGGDALVPCSWETADPSPHALPGSIVPFIALVLGEPAAGIDHDVDPRWQRVSTPVQAR